MVTHAGVDMSINFKINHTQLFNEIPRLKPQSIYPNFRVEGALDAGKHPQETPRKRSCRYSQLCGKTDDTADEHHQLEKNKKKARSSDKRAQGKIIKLFNSNSGVTTWKIMNFTINFRGITNIAKTQFQITLK